MMHERYKLSGFDLGSALSINTSMSMSMFDSIINYFQVRKKPGTVKVKKTRRYRDRNPGGGSSGGGGDGGCGGGSGGGGGCGGDGGG